uniref:Crinkler effector protein N-terminal domain-containing protein n=1 Tax=Globisporangium ultimum (strain ATCC 200006 / CBS 805.95 / DAOM BR144) TaxID=431595 RepID=K3X1N9_GLOUD
MALVELQCAVLGEEGNIFPVVADLNAYAEDLRYTIFYQKFSRRCNLLPFDVALYLAKDMSGSEWLTDNADLDAFLKGGQVSSQLVRMWPNCRLNHPEYLGTNFEPRNNEINVLVHVKSKRAVLPESAKENPRPERSIDTKLAEDATTIGLSSRPRWPSGRLPSLCPPQMFSGTSLQLKKNV